MYIFINSMSDASRCSLLAESTSTNNAKYKSVLDKKGTLLKRLFLLLVLTVHFVPITTFAQTPQVHKYFDFDGNDHVVLEKPEYDLSGGLSLSLWVKPLSNDENGVLVSYTGVAGYELYMSGSWHLRMDGNKPKFSVYGESSNGWQQTIESVTAADALVKDKWQHVAVTYDNDSCKIYVDGKLSSKAPLSIAVNSLTKKDNTSDKTYVDSRFSIGVEFKISSNIHYPKADHFWDDLPINGFRGGIDEVKLWDENASIKDVMSAKYIKSTANDDHLLAYYPFDAQTSIHRDECFDVTISRSSWSKGNASGNVTTPQVRTKEHCIDDDEYFVTKDVISEKDAFCGLSGLWELYEVEIEFIWKAIGTYTTIEKKSGTHYYTGTGSRHFAELNSHTDEGVLRYDDIAYLSQFSLNATMGSLAAAVNSKVGYSGFKGFNSEIILHQTTAEKGTTTDYIPANYGNRLKQVWSCEKFLEAGDRNFVKLSFNLDDNSIIGSVESLLRYQLLKSTTLTGEYEPFQTAYSKFIETINDKTYLSIIIKASELPSDDEFFTIGQYNYNNYAAEFNGINKYAEVKDVDFDKIGPEGFTIETLVKLSAGYQPIFQHGNYSSLNSDMFLAVDKQDESLTFKCKSITIEANSTLLSSSDYLKLTAVVDNDNEKMAIYLNGNLLGEETMDSKYTSKANLSIAKIVQQEAETLDGLMDEFKIWSYAKSSDEIYNDLYYTNQSGSDDLVIYYNFDDYVEVGDGILTNYGKPNALFATVLKKDEEQKSPFANNELNLESIGIYLKEVDVNNLAGGYVLDLTSETGTGNVLTIEDNDDYFDEDFTVDIHIEPSNTLGSSRAIILEQEDGIIIAMNKNGKIRASTIDDNGDSSTVKSITPVKKEQWNHIALTFTEGVTSTLVLYINGIPMAANTDAKNVAYSNNNPISVGKDLHSKLDEIRIWNSALNISEINGLRGKIVRGAESGLIMAYGFEENIPLQDGVVRDKSSFANHAEPKEGTNLIQSLSINNTIGTTAISYKDNVESSHVEGLNIEILPPSSSTTGFYTSDFDVLTWSANGAGGFIKSNVLDEELNKSWLVTKKDHDDDFFGNANLSFDPAGCGDNVVFAGGNSYILLYRESFSDNYSVLPYKTDIIQSGGKIVFSLAEDNLLNGYYSIGIAPKGNGKALRFDKTTSKIGEFENAQGVSYHTNDLSTNYKTFEFWGKLPINSSSKDIFVAGFDNIGSNKTGFHLYLKANSNELWFKIKGEGVQAEDTKVDEIDANHWTHYSAQIHASGANEIWVRLMKNGGLLKQWKSVITPKQVSKFGFYVGDELSGNDSLIIDEVKIWNGWRSSSVVSDGYRQLQESSVTNLLAYYNFDQKEENSINLSSSELATSDYIESGKMSRENWGVANWYLEADKVGVFSGKEINTTGGLSIELGDYRSIYWSYNGVTGIESSINDPAFYKSRREWLVHFELKSFDSRNSLLTFDLDEIEINVNDTTRSYFLLLKDEISGNFEALTTRASYISYDANKKPYINFIVSEDEIVGASVSNWKFDKTFALGVSKSNHDLALALEYSARGGNDLLHINESKIDPQMEDLNVQAWIKFKSKNRPHSIFNSDSFNIRVNKSNLIVVQLYDSLYKFWLPSFQIDEWYYLTVGVETGKAKKIILQLNGYRKERFIGKSNKLVVGSSILVGKDYNYKKPGDHADFIIDDIRIWNRKLLKKEIAAKSKTKLRGLEPGLLYNYQFDIGKNTSWATVNSNCDGRSSLRNFAYSYDYEYVDATDKFPRSNATSVSLQDNNPVVSGNLTVTSPFIPGVTFGSIVIPPTPKLGAFLSDDNDNLFLSNEGSFTLSDFSNSLPRQIDKILDRTWDIEIFDDFNNGGELVLSLDVTALDLNVKDVDFYLLSIINGNYLIVSTTKVISKPGLVEMSVDARDISMGTYTFGISKPGRGNMVLLDGVNDYNDLGTSLFPISEDLPFTIETTLMPKSAGVIFFKNIGDKVVSLEIDENNRLVGKRNGKTAYSSNSVELNKMQHLAMVYDQAKISVYINGILEGDYVSTDNLGSATSKDLNAIVGAATNSSHSQFESFLNAYFDDFKVWSKALKPYELKHSMLANRVNDEDLVLNFRFNNVGSGINGNYTNNPSFARTKNADLSATDSENINEYVFGSMSLSKGNITGSVNELSITDASSTNFKNNGFFNDDDDNVFLGFVKDGMYSFKTEGTNKRVAGIWKLKKNDDSNNGGLVTLSFSKSDRWAGASWEYTYYLLWKSEMEDSFELVDFKKYYKDLVASEVAFQVNLADLKDGYYSLGFGKQGNLLKATDGASDAFVDVNWKIPAYCFKENGNRPVQIELEDLNGVLYSRKLDSFSIDSFFKDNYRHYPGPSKGAEYSLHIYNIGLGQKVCDNMFNHFGQTDNFRLPKLELGDLSLNSIELNWTTETDLADKWRVTRKLVSDTTVAVQFFIDATDRNFIDKLNSDTNSIRNGEEYIYILEAYNNRFLKYYKRATIKAKTDYLDFVATDKLFDDSVRLSWGSITQYADEILVKRDGKLLAILEGDNINYVDKEPVFGKNHNYSIELYKNNEFVIGSNDSGSVKARGVIKGRVLTDKGYYAVPNCVVNVVVVVDGVTYEYDTLTSITGQFELQNIYFGEKAEIKIIPVLDGHSFTESYYTDSLSLLKPILENVVLKSLKEYNENGDADLTFSDLELLLKGTKSRNVNYLKWYYSSSETVLFQILRNDTLLDILVNDNKFIDVQAVPGSKHKYDVVAYIFKNDEITILQDELNVKSRGLIGLGKKALFSEIDNAKGLVELKWVYKYQGIDGFEILRDDDVISSSENQFFTDFSGKNNELLNYGIRTYKEINGKRYKSATRKIKVLYPTLKRPVGLKLGTNEKDDKGLVTIGFTAFEGEGDYNFDGYEVYRRVYDADVDTLEYSNPDDTMFRIASVKKGSEYFYKDRDGEYEQKYVYYIKGVKYSSNSRSEAVFSTITYPLLSKPKILEVARIDATINMHLVKWAPKTAEYSGTELVINGDTFYMTKGVRSKKVYLAAKSTDTDYKISLKNTVSKNDKVYTSSAAETIYTVAKDDVESVYFTKGITNFSASTDIANYVLLEWEFPSYIKTKKGGFRIYRDGDTSAIARISATNRSFLDKNATVGEEHAYLLRAEMKKANDETKYVSNYAVAYGKRKPNGVLTGVVYNKFTKNGVPNVLVNITGKDITVSNNDLDTTIQEYFGSAYSDSTGFYKVKAVPEWGSTVFTVSAEKQGYIFDNQSIDAAEEDDLNYVANFIDANKVDIVNKVGAVSEPIALVAIPNFENQQVELRFGLNGTNYSGIEVFRSGKTIDTLRKGQLNSYIDVDGIPDYSYQYRIRAYLEYGGKTYYSKVLTKLVSFPSVQPVYKLYAIPEDSLGYVKLSWVHKTELLDVYEIWCNSVKIATVEKDVNEYIDEEGIPGNLCKYEVRAVKKLGSSTVSSKPISASVRFPYLPRVFNISSASLESLNAVKITWQFPLERIRQFYLLRNGIELATLRFEQNETLFEYIDSFGIPGKTNRYTIIPYFKKEGKPYSGMPSAYSTKLLKIFAPANLNVVAKAGKDKIVVDWEYDTKNVDGFEVLVNGDTVATLGASSRSFEFFNGSPEKSYRFEVLAFHVRGNETYRSDMKFKSVNFPKVSAPNKFKASKYLSNNHIQLYWKLESWDDYSNEDRGFEIMTIEWPLDAEAASDLSSTAWSSLSTNSLNSLSRTFVVENPIDILKSQARNRYKIRSYRVIDGVKSYSDWVLTNKPGISSKAENVTDGVYKAKNFIASAGTFSNRVELKWKDGTSTVAGLEGYKIYRRAIDNSSRKLIGTIKLNTELFIDRNLELGVTYVYEIIPFFTSSAHQANENVEGITKIGWAKGAGNINGSVFTYATSNGIPNVKVVATTTIKNETVVYTTKTDKNGEFEFDEGLIIDGEREYKVEVFFLDHKFSEKVKEVTLTDLSTSKTLTPFYDEDVFMIKGDIVYKNAGCRISQANLYYTEIYNDNTTSVPELIEVIDGSYKKVYNPFAENLKMVRVEILDSFVAVAADNPQFFQFEKLKYELKDLSEIKTITTRNFREITTIPVVFNVGTACGPIDGKNKFEINVRSIDGCYNRTFKTDEAGYAKVNLPPFNYEASIVGVEPLTAINYPYLQSLSTIISEMNLRDLLEATKLTREDLFPTGPDTVSFIFHKEPEITVLGFKTETCKNSESVAIQIMDKNDTETLQFMVEESFINGKCSVKTGKILVRNEGDVNDETKEIVFNKTDGHFGEYTLVVNNPNPVEPYYRNLIIEYYDENGNFQAEKIVPIIILGSSLVPGNDIIVDPNADDESTVPLPLFVLRDPPGDKSYSYIEEGTELTTIIKADGGFMQESGWTSEINFLPGGYGIAVEDYVGQEESSSSSKELRVTTKTSQRISTLADGDVLSKNNNSYLIGRNADIIVGAGAVSTYGISWEIKNNGTGDECLIEKEKTLTFGIGEISTTWIYTIDQIESLIGEYHQAIEDYDNGIVKAEDEKGKVVNIRGKYETYIDNWNEVLRYHKTLTNPMYAICAGSDKNDIPEEYKELYAEIKRERFCELIGDYDDQGGQFVMDDDITWSEEMINTFNGLYILDYHWDVDPVRFSELSDGALGVRATLVGLNRLNKINDPAWDAYDRFLRDEDVVNWGLEYKSYLAPFAENITFSGGTEFTKEFGISKGEERAEFNSWQLNYTGFTGFMADDEVKAGSLFFSKTGYKTKGKLGVQINSFNSGSNSTTTDEADETTIGYVLSDDDPGDQYSVMVFRGINTNVTPYFATLGGRSSCPYEFYGYEWDENNQTNGKSDPKFVKVNELAISRDQYQIELKEGQNSIQRYLNDGEKAKFTIKITNLSPFGESRFFALEPSLNSNKNGAKISVGGKALNHQEFLIEAQESIYIDVEIERAQDIFKHDDIKLYFFPACDPNFDAQELHLECSWLHPCTDISILTKDSWTINSSDKSATNELDRLERLKVVLGDYDVNNELLKEIRMSYRRVGSENADNAKQWKPFPEEYDLIKREKLVEVYEETKGAVHLPAQYVLYWDITNTPSIIDGEYEIKADYLCDVVGLQTSNIIKGRVDRRSFLMVGQPYPLDGILSLGEEVKVAYNKDINCERLMAEHIRISYNAGSDIIPVEIYTGTDKVDQLTVSVSCLNNQLFFYFSDSLRKKLDGKEVKVTVDSLWDQKDNLHGYAKGLEWSFDVSYNPVYLNPTALNVKLFEGSKTTVSSALLYQKFANILNYELTIKDGKLLSTTTSSGMVALTGEKLEFVVDGDTLPGAYSDTVRVAIEGYGTLKLPIDIEVVEIEKKPPFLHVNPSDFATSMLVTTNFKTIGNSMPTFSKNADDIIAAYIGSELRGVGRVTEIEGDFAAFVTIYGNANEKDDSISYRVWRAHDGKLYNANLITAHVGIAGIFKPRSLVGTFAEPIELQVNLVNDKMHMIPLKAGWNWLSFNTKPTSLNKALRSLSPRDGDKIITQFASTEFTTLGMSSDSTGKWVAIPDKDGISTVNPALGYKLKLSKADTLYLYGEKATNVDYTLNNKGGWNLIGHPKERAVSLDSVGTKQNDIIVIELSSKDTIMSQTQSATYNGTKWLGNLEQLEPYKSYLAKFGHEDASNVSWKKSPRPENWAVNPGAYQYNMVVTGRLVINEEVSLDNRDIVGAFVDDELRGVAKLNYLPELDRYRVVLFVYSNEAEGEVVKFKLFDYESEILYDAFDHVNFVADKTIGKLSDPFVFSNNLSIGIDLPTPVEMNLSALPNPFAGTTKVTFNSSNEGQYNLVVFNAVGKEVYSRNLNALEGENDVMLDFEGLQIADGIYYVQLKGKQQSGIVKVVKQ